MWIFLFVFILADAAKYPSSMCDINQTEDCSFQLPNAAKNSCLIYNTAVCLKQFSNITEPGEKLNSELDSASSISVYPYAAVVYKLQEDIPLSAINITLTILRQDVKYILVTIKYILLTKGRTINKTMCRIFDFRGYSEEIHIPTTFFYDCFYNLVENNIQNVWMSFKSMPMNEELNYYVFIPPAITLDSKWQPVIMIFCESLSKGIISMKFSAAPHTLNISSYSVNLVQGISNKVMQSKLVNLTSQGKMINVEFSSVETDTYYIIITPINMNGTKYLSTKTASFEVIAHDFDKMFVLYICIVFLLSLSFFSIVKCFRSFLHRDFPPKTVLLVYSLDCPEHEKFVSSFAEYLKNACNLIVNTIYGTILDPQQWIRDKYREAEVIIYIISEGLFLTFEGDKSSRPKFTTHWPYQLPDAEAYISHQIFNNDRSCRKKFCKVYFPYASEKFVPQCLRDDRGKGYKLPKEFNQLLCFIFDCEPLISFVNFYPKLRGYQPQSSSIGQEMLEKMKFIQVAAKNNCHLRNEVSKHIKKNAENSIYSDKEKSSSALHAASTNNLTVSSEVDGSPSATKSSSARLKAVNYIPVNTEDSESCDEIEFKCSNVDNNGSNIEDLVNYMKQVHSASRNYIRHNPMTPLVEKELNQ